MEISGFSSFINAVGQFSSTGRAELQPVDDSNKSEEPHRHRGRRHGGRHGHALGVFRQELRLALKANFHAKFPTAQQNYATVREPATSDDVADEALGAAKQMVAESPVKAAKSLISFRAKVQETATYVRETVGVNDDVEGMDKAVARLGEGLDDLEADVARNRESSASVLAVDTRTKQRSVIKIRTQEGDLVKLSLKRRDSVSATDVAVSNGNGSATSTEIEVSSRSRMMLKVEGDLNDSELAAIQNVFAQAEQIASDFFGGDIAKAFSFAEGFEFDTEQLARVRMRFGMSHVSNISYSEAMRPPRLPPESPPGIEGPRPKVIPKPPVEAPILAAQPAASTPVVSASPAAAAPVDEALAEPVLASAANSIDGSDAAAPSSQGVTTALSDFMETLGAFLRSISEGFQAVESNASFTYHYSESFKLTLLNAVVHALAPEGSAEAAATAESVVREVIE